MKRHKNGRSIKKEKKMLLLNGQKKASLTGTAK